MATVGDVVGNLRGDSPWLLFVAGALLAAAGAVGRRVTGSLQRIGARVGDLERRADSEQTRRRQVEAELLELGVPLPYWPDDPVGPRELAVMRRRLSLAERVRDDEDQDYDDPPPPPPATPEASYAPPPVPPFPDDERARLARHRR